MAAADRIALVLGARNLGGAIAARLASDGWKVAAVARSADGLAGVRQRGVLGVEAQELREEGIHVALLVVDGTIESPKTAAFTGDAPRESLVDQADVAAAVAYLAAQSPRAMTHELVVTPQGDRWVP